jgi:lipopolysaccharide biosynthesis glycosyltransferase
MFYLTFGVAGGSPTPTSSRTAVMNLLAMTKGANPDKMHNYVSAVLTQRYALKKKGLKFDAYVVLHDDQLDDKDIAHLTSVGVECRRMDTLPIISEKTLAKIKKSTQVRDVGGVIFHKLMEFQMLKDFDLVLVLDVDLLPLRDISDLFTMVTLTSEKPVAGVLDKASLPFPEHNGGLFLFKPALIDYNDVISHLDDEWISGYRAEDQSFYSHYFHGRWHDLPRNLNVLVKSSWRKEYGHPSKFRILHFNGPKPWDYSNETTLPSSHTREMFLKWWEMFRECQECVDYRKTFRL